MTPTILLAETHLINTLSPNIELSNLRLLKNTTTTQEKTTTPNNTDAVVWDTLAH